MKKIIFTLLILIGLNEAIFSQEINTILFDDEIKLFQGVSHRVYGGNSQISSHSLAGNDKIGTILKFSSDETGYMKFFEKENGKQIKIIDFKWEYLNFGYDNVIHEGSLPAGNIDISFYPPYYIIETDGVRIDYIQPGITERGDKYIMWFTNLGNENVFITQFFY